MNIKQLQQILTSALSSGLSEDTPVCLVSDDMSVQDYIGNGCTELESVELITSHYRKQAPILMGETYAKNRILILVGNGADFDDIEEWHGAFRQDAE